MRRERVRSRAALCYHGNGWERQRGEEARFVGAKAEQGSDRPSSSVYLLHAPSRGFRSFRRPSGNMHLPQELGEVRALKAQLLGGLGLVPSVPAQGVFNYLLFIDFHRLMVVPGWNMSLGYMLSCFGHGGKREMLRLNRFVGAEDEGSGQHILQLPDIARPRILLQHPQGTVAQGTASLGPQFSGAAEEILGERGEIIHPLTQRWECD